MRFFRLVPALNPFLSPRRPAAGFRLLAAAASRLRAPGLRPGCSSGRGPLGAMCLLAACAMLATVAAGAPAALGNDNGDTVPYLGLDSPSVQEGDSGTTTLTFTARLTDANGRTQASKQKITADYQVLSESDDTAAAGKDYRAASGTLTFAPGETSRTIDVSVMGDTEVEGDETLTLKWVAPWTNVLLASYTATGTIRNDDQEEEETPRSDDRPYLSANSPSVQEGDSGATTLTFTARLTDANGRTQASTETITANYQVLSESGDSATAGKDYTAASGTVTFAPGETSGTIDVSVMGDTEVEGDETLTLKWVAPWTNVLLASYTATGTIKNDDDSATLTIADASADEGKAIAFTVTLDQAVSGGFKVTPIFTDGTATKGSDYTENTTALDFAGTAGETVSFTVATTDDGDEEGDETFTVGLAVSGTTHEVTATSTATGTITDDDEKDEVKTSSQYGGLSVTANVSSINEKDSGRTVTVEVGAPPAIHDIEVTVQVGSSSDSATEGTDYNTVADFTVTVPGTGYANYADGTFTLTPKQDSRYEGNETIKIEVSAEGTTSNSTTITLTDDDIKLTATVTGVNEGDAARTVTVTATAASTHSAKRGMGVYIGGTNDSATEGTDYANVVEHTINIEANQTTGSTSFTLTPTQDTTVEGDESLSITGWVAGGWSVVGTSIAIYDDDYSLSVNPSSLDEDAGTRQVTVTACCGTAAGARSVRVKVGKSSDSFKEGTDYKTVRDFDITIATGAANGTGTFNLALQANSVTNAPSRTISVTGTSSHGSVSGTSISILDDDRDFDIRTELDVSSASEDGGAKTVKVTAIMNLDTYDSWFEVDISVGKSGDSATEGTDYASVADFTIRVPQTETRGSKTFTLTPTNDTNIEGTETISVTGTTLVGSGKVQTSFLSLTDDDATSIALSANKSTVSEGASATTVTVTATAAKNLSAASAVTVYVGDSGSADYGIDYAKVSDFTINIASGSKTGTGTFTLTPTDDSSVEGDETIGIGGSVTGHSLTGTSLTLSDNDTHAITLSASPTSVAEDASGTSVTVTATAGSSISSARTVTVAVGGSGTATSGTDYAAVTNFDITIAANATSGTGTFTLTPTDDSSVEGDETIGISGSGTLLTVTGTSLTLSDDDTYAITLSASPTSVAEDASGTSVTVTATAGSAISSARTVSVVVGGSGDGATEGTDYATVADTTITIAANATSGTVAFTLTPTQDTSAEGEETIGITGSGTLMTVTGTSIKITDDDVRTISLSANKSTVGEGAGATTVTVTATANSAVSEATTVTVSVGASGDGATEGTDYSTVADFDITIAKDATKGTGTFTLTPTDDTDYEEEESVSMSGSSSPHTVTGTSLNIGNNDGIGISLSASPSSVVEGAGSTSVTVTATAAQNVKAKTDVTVQVGKSTDSATEGTDYPTVNDFTLSIAKGSKTGTAKFSLIPNADKKDSESNETISVEGSSSPHTVTGTSLTLTNATASNPITLSVSPSSVGEAAGATSVTVTARMQTSFKGAGDVTVTVGTSGSATSGTDYGAVSDITLNFSADSPTTATGTFTLTPTDDSLVENNETVWVDGTSDYGQVVGASVTINDNDGAAITLSANKTSVSEGASGTSVTVTATASAASSNARTVTVSVGQNGDSAIEGTDYSEVSNFAITIAANQTSGTGTFTLTPTQDDVVEGSESLTISGSGTGLNVTGTSVTLTDDDAAPAVNLSVSPASVTEGASDPLNLAGGKNVTVTAAFSTSKTYAYDRTVAVSVGGSGTATSDTDYDAVSNFNVKISAGQTSGTGTFKLKSEDDDVFEGDETIGVAGTATGLTVNSATLTLADNDSATLTLGDASAAEGDSLTFTVSLNNAVQGGLTVTPSYTNGTADDGDYEKKSNPQTLTFTGTANESHSFKVPSIEDAVLEAAETFTVGMSVSNAPSGITATDTGTGTINNDDSATVTIDDANAAEGDDLTFTVTLSEAVQGGLTVTPDFTDVSAVEGTDYDENTTALTFTGTKGETQTFIVSTTEETNVEAAETFTVGLTVSNAPTGTTVTATDTGTGTINNDDSSTVTIEDADADEGDDITFTVTLSEAVQGGLTVTPSYTNGTTASGDYTANTTALTFTGTKGETQTFTVSTTEDAVLESDETFTVGMSVSGVPAGSTVTATDTGTGTINDDDSAAVTINDANADEGGSMTFTVTLSEAVQGGLTVTPSYTNGTTASGDYTANTTALTFTGTKEETKTFTVSTKEDAVLESDETFTVGLAVSDAPTGTTVTATDTGTGTINDDDRAAVTINDADADEGDDITFTVTLSAAVQGGLTVTPDFTDGTADEGPDYKENTAALTFSGTKGETQTFTVSTTEDAVVEGAETFTVGLTASDAPAGTTVTDTDTGTGTINNDDGAVVTVNDASADEGGSITFTVTLGAAVQGGLTVTPDFTDVTAVEGTDYDENTTALTFSGTKGETKSFTVSTTEDAVVEHPETFTVGLTASDAPAGTTVTDTDTGTGTINNDDGAAVTVNDAKADEGDSMTFTVTLSEAVQGGLTVTPDFTDVTAVEGTDYDENTAALSFSGTKGETKSFSVSTTEDAVVEYPETFTVGLSVSKAPKGITSSDTGTGTIDNDDSATVSVSDGSATESNAITFTVSLSAAVQGGLTVTPGYTNGTAASSDYTANTTALTFSGTKGETKSFSVSTTEDAVLEYDETFTVGLTVSKAPPGVSAAGAGGGASANGFAFASMGASASGGGTGTILNDDDANLSVSSVSSFEGGVMSFTVTLDKVVQGGLTATPVYTNVTASDGDYNGGGALSFSGAAGEQQSLAVSAVDDEVVESDETFTVGLTVSDAPAGVSTGAGTGTIHDDDELPAVSLSGPAGIQNGPFAVSIDFTRTVGGFDASDLTVGNGTASLSGSGSSYTAAITPSSSGTVTVYVAAGVAQDGHGNGNSASNQYAVEADLDRPSVRLSGPADVQGGPFAVSIDFSEKVSGFEASEVAVSNGTASLSGSGSSYTAMITPSSSDTVTVDVASAVAHDLAGNDNTAAAQYAVVADLVSPSVRLSGPAGPVASSFTVSIDFSEEVAGFEASDLTVSNGAASDFSGSGSSYSAKITPSSGGRLTVDVAAGAAHDAGGRGNSAAVQYAVEVDLDPPSVRLSGPAGPVAGAFTVAIEFSEPVSGFETSEVAVSNGTARLSGSGSSYAAVITPLASGTVTVDVAANVAQDAAGHDNTAADRYTVSADLVVPSVTLRGPADVQGGSFTVAIEFSEAVDGFEVSEVAVSNGTARLSGSGSSYAAVITPLASGTVTVDVAANVAQDVAGNGNSAADRYKVEADLVAPSVTLRGPADVQGGSFTVAIEFSEAVDGFEVSEVAVSNGTARLSGSGSSYAAVITPLASGTVTVDVAANVAQDVAGNGNSAADRYKVEADLVAPSVTLRGPADTQGGPFTVAIEFSEAVDGFEVSEVAVSNGTARLSGSGSRYTAMITPSSSGQVTVDVAAGVAHDVAGNGNSAAAQYAVTADLVAPSVTLRGPAGPVAGAFTVTITFSESVSGFESSEVTVSNGTAALSGTGSSYSAVVTPLSSGPVTVDVAAGAAVDARGHLNSAAVQYAVEADLVVPSVSLSGPAATQGGPFTVAIEFSEAVDGFEASDVTVSNGTAALSGTGSSYSAVVTPSSSGPVTVDVAAGVAHDAAGNGNSAAAQYAVAADLDPPSVSLSGPAGPVTAAFTVTITFSEAVDGFETSEVTVSNGTATLSGTGTSYSAVVTPSSSGPVTVDVAAGVAHDAAGNGNGAAAQYAVTADLNRAPVFAAAAVRRSVAENSPAGAAIGAPVTAAGDTLTYSLAGADAASFAIDAGSGQLRTRAALDYETRTTYAVSVEAADGNGGRAVQAVTIAVTDVDEPPAAPAAPQVSAASTTSLKVEWTAPANAGRPAINDYDLQYRKRNGTAWTAQAFTGAGTETAIAALQSGAAYEVQVRAVNDEGAGPWSAPGSGAPAAAVNRAPRFVESGLAYAQPSGADFGEEVAAAVRRSVAENSPSGTAIGAPVAASDADGDALTYSLSGADAASFALDADSGQLRTRAALDYETRTTYAVSVEAADGNGGRAVQAVAIAVTDVDEAPAAAADEATVAEGGAVTIAVLANDTDPEGGTLRVELVETAAHGAATIDAAGVVTYTHDGGETTADGFSYRVHDGSAYSDAAAVTITVTPVNDAPAADAGADREVDEGETVYLSGTGTDPEGEALTFAWTQVSGEAVALSAAASAAAQFTAPVQLAADAVLVFSLVVTDASGAVSAPDEVTVTVAAGTNDAPIADAGADREVAEGETVYLSGSGTDPEGEALSFAWTQVSGASVELSGAVSDSLGFTAPSMLSEDAVLVFSLVVTDARGLASAPDEVTVTVKAAPNKAPVFAAPDYTFGLVEHVDAGADPLTVGDVLARDPEDEGVAYALAAGDSSRFAVDAASGRITYTGPGEDARNTGSYVLAVSAADPRGASSTVTVTILVGVARVAKKSVLSAEQMEIRRTQRAEVMELSLAALGRTLAASTVDVVGRRVESSAAAEGSYAELAGRRLSGAPGGGASAALSLEAAMAGQEGFSGGEAVSEQEMLTGSSFQWALERPGRGVWTLWGRGVFNGFAGQPRGRDFTMHDGQLSQGYMGLDYRRGGGALAGVALSHGASELYYESGSVGRGDVLARLLSVYPYARWAPRPGLDLWGLVGLGRGEARLVYDGRTDLSSDLGLRLAAVGARNLLLTYRGVGVAARADAFAVRLQPEENEELARVRADARRLRLLLEGTVNWTLTPQSRLTPSLEVGGRWDGGDAERGLGAEVGGGLHYAHQNNGLDVEVRGRRLLAHGESAFKDWGASVVLRLAPGDRRGLGLELEPAWGRGARQQSAQDLWRDEQAAPALESDRSASRRPDRTDLRLSYGLEHPAGTLTPFGEWALDREAGSLRLGARLEGGESESAEKGRRWVEIFGERRAHAGASPERRVGVQGNLTY